jgi:GT2 family glycosyltransferase
MQPPLVFNIILNTNRREDTLACLESLANSTYSNQLTLVLDNASTDGSVKTIQNRYPDVRVIPLLENKGYAGNNNVGIKLALEQGAEWVFILNEDVILAPDCLECLMQSSCADPLIGIMGPMVYHFTEPTIIQSAGGLLSRDWVSVHRGQNQEDRGQFSYPDQVDWISGCAILIHRNVIDQVGLLDEWFFYYWEETEWCLRARKSGWKIVHVPVAHIWHKGVQRDYVPSPNVTYYATRNWFFLLNKHHAPWHVRLRAGWRTVRTMASWTILPKWRGMRAHRDAMWQGVVDYLHHKGGMRAYR